MHDIDSIYLICCLWSGSQWTMKLDEGCEWEQVYILIIKKQGIKDWQLQYDYRLLMF
jgi:hypothetical protein